MSWLSPAKVGCGQNVGRMLSGFNVERMLILVGYGQEPTSLHVGCGLWPECGEAVE